MNIKIKYGEIQSDNATNTQKFYEQGFIRGSILLRDVLKPGENSEMVITNIEIHSHAELESSLILEIDDKHYEIVNSQLNGAQGNIYFGKRIKLKGK
jgi:hypothetical protein